MRDTLREEDVEGGEEAESSPSGHLRIQLDGLRDVTEPSAQPGGSRGGVAAERLCIPGVWGEHSGQGFSRTWFCRSHWGQISAVMLAGWILEMTTKVEVESNRHSHQNLVKSRPPGGRLCLACHNSLAGKHDAPDVFPVDRRLNQFGLVTVDDLELL